MLGFSFREDTKEEPTIKDLSDDELTAKITQTMWKVTKSNTGVDELQKYHDEVKSRGKYYLWNRAKDCFNA